MTIVITDRRAIVNGNNFNLSFDVSKCETIIDVNILLVKEGCNKFGIDYTDVQITATLNGTQKIAPTYNFTSVTDLQTKLENYIKDCNLFFFN